MNITATGTSSLSSLYLQKLLESSGQTSSSSSSSGTGTTDSLTISDAAQQAANGQDPFQSDLSALESAVDSGDLTTAKSQYQAMLKKMQGNGAGSVPSDFQALGTALDSGDLSGVQSAMATVVKNVASHQPPSGAPGGRPPQSDASSTASTDATTDTTDTASLIAQLQALASSAYARTSELGS